MGAGVSDRRDCEGSERTNVAITSLAKGLGAASGELLLRALTALSLTSTGSHLGNVIAAQLAKDSAFQRELVSLLQGQDQARQDQAAAYSRVADATSHELS